MTIHETVKEHMKEAMREKNELKLLVVRGMLSAFMTETMNLKRKPDEKLNDDEALAVIRRLVKQRKDSIDQFEKGGRSDLAENERAELSILEVYLPAALSREELEKIARVKKEELGVTDKTKTGILVGAVMKAAGGNADGGVVKEIVESLF